MHSKTHPRGTKQRWISHLTTNYIAKYICMSISVNCSNEKLIGCQVELNYFKTTRKEIGRLNIYNTNLYF